MKRLLISCAMLMFSGVLSAGCFQYDLNGFWKTYSFNSFGEVYDCSFFLRGNGSVNTSISSCFIVNTNNESGTTPITGGQINVARNCSITGYIDINGTRNTIRSATLSNSKSYGTGIVTFNANGFGTSIFNLVRRNF